MNDYIINGTYTFSIIYKKNNTLVIENPEYPEYLLKLSDKDFKSSQIQSKILSSIPDENNNICRIHHTQIYDDNAKIRTVELIDKLHGTPKPEYSKNDIENVFKATKQLHCKLNESTDKYHKDLPSIGPLFSSIIDSTLNPTLKVIANRVQNDYAYEKFLDAEKQYIIFADMVYENILIDKDKINIIDLDPLILGPKRLQFSILLTSNILIQSNQFKNLSMDLINHYTNLWGIEKISREDLIALSIFPLLILSMKQVDIDLISEKQDSIYFKLKTILSFIIAELDNVT